VTITPIATATRKTARELPKRPVPRRWNTAPEPVIFEKGDARHGEESERGERAVELLVLEYLLQLRLGLAQ
jgi:hypothetical protein